MTLLRGGCGRYLDIRVYSTIRPGDRPSVPTEHGLVLDVDLLLDLRRAIDQALIALGDEGLPVGEKT
ncbi:MAG: hypothetical protein NTX30_20760 [Deltaproteobacteria bacterium]|nr:hypothetical protein [Deltaproteobacteria bacterium]